MADQFRAVAWRQFSSAFVCRLDECDYIKILKLSKSTEAQSFFPLFPPVIFWCWKKAFIYFPQTCQKREGWNFFPSPLFSIAVDELPCSNIPCELAKAWIYFKCVFRPSHIVVRVSKNFLRSRSKNKHFLTSLKGVEL